MKQGWETKKLGDVLVKTETVDPTKRPNEEFTYLDVSSVNKETKEIENTTVLFGKDAPSRARKLVKTNDVIFATVRPTHGRVALITEEYDEQVCSTGYFVLRGKDYIFNQYLFYFILTDEFNGQMENLQKGASYPAVTDAEVKSIFLRFPKSLLEQQRIVAILDEAFEAIASAKAKAEQNLKNAKELYSSLLLNIFIDGINVKKWTLEKLEKYNKVVVGYVGSISKEYTTDEGDVLLLSTKNINNKGISLEKLTRVNRHFHNKNKKSQLIPGDILVARHGNSGQAAVIPENIKEAQALNVIIIKKSTTLSSEYICFLLNSGVLDKIASSKAGSVQEIINTSIIKELIIPVPTKTEQQAIVQKLDALSSETKRLEAIYQQKIAGLEELKKSVLQKAFSGELTKSEKIAV